MDLLSNTADGRASCSPNCDCTGAEAGAGVAHSTLGGQRVRFCLLGRPVFACGWTPTGSPLDVRILHIFLQINTKELAFLEKSKKRKEDI